MSSKVSVEPAPKLKRISACLMRPLRGTGVWAPAAAATPAAATAVRKSRRRIRRVIADNWRFAINSWRRNAREIGIGSHDTCSGGGAGLGPDGDRHAARHGDGRQRRSEERRVGKAG